MRPLWRRRIRRGGLRIWHGLRREVPGIAQTEMLGGRLDQSAVTARGLRRRTGKCRLSESHPQPANPYYIGDEPGLTQTSGWVDAWTSAPSIYAVAATRTEDVVAAVNFARENNLRLVVKGGGHSYQGTSSSADSLLIWTRAMNSIVLHDAFVAQGCMGKQAPQPAVTVGGRRDLDAGL